MSKYQFAIRLALSLPLGAVGLVLGAGIQMQLNATLTGNYQHNFMGDHVPMFYIAYLFAGIGVMVPWLVRIPNRKQSRENQQ